MGQFALPLRKILGYQGRILQAALVVLLLRKALNTQRILTAGFASQKYLSQPRLLNTQRILTAGFALSLKKQPSARGQALVEALLSVIAAVSFLWLLQGLYLQSQESIQKERLSSSSSSKKQAPWAQLKELE